MIGSNSKEKPVLFLSKSLIIIAILAAALLSFLLGFFVGKSTIEVPLNTKPQPVTSSPETKPQVPSQAFVSPREGAPQPETVALPKETRLKEPLQKQKPKKIIYTVQVGAFENTAEADALKEKLDKKGYKPYVITPASQGNGKLYKVRIGEFSSRQEAEALSNKIKKSTGLQTFVTFKTE